MRKATGFVCCAKSFIFNALMKLSDRSSLTIKSEVSLSGLMLSLIRDYFKSILLSYKNLYITASTYGIKKELSSNQYKEDLKSEILELGNSIKLAESEVAELSDKINVKVADFDLQNKVL